MVKEFLDKVLSQLIRETDITYYDRKFAWNNGTPYYDGKMFFPFFPETNFNIGETIFYEFAIDSDPWISFTNHCSSVYGLNEEEILYVWGEYKVFILPKLKEGIDMDNIFK